jgi:DedD protein
MTKSTFSRHGKIRVAAVSLVGGIMIGACSPMSDQPAPVYMVPITSSAAPDAVAAAPIEREAMAPVAPATAAGHPASDVIALDNLPPQPAPAPARQATDPASTQAMLPPPTAPAPTPAPALVASPANASPPSAAVPVAASARPEPSVAAEARADPASPPAPERTVEPARADIATPGLLVSMRGDRAARSRPRYYYSP